MGGTLSDWQGLKLTTTSSNNFSVKNQYVDLFPISCTNSIKSAGSTSILANAGVDSTFQGYIHFYDANQPTSTGTVTVDHSIVYVQRITDPTEQTNDEETVVRIEAGRNLKSTFYDRDGTSVDFEVVL